MSEIYLKYKGVWKGVWNKFEAKIKSNHLQHIRIMESVEFFEGPEKLMEVWWTPILEADREVETTLTS